MKHEKQVEIQNAAVQVVTRLMLGLSLLYMDYCVSVDVPETLPTCCWQ